MPARPVVFVVTHVVPFPPGAGNELRLARLIEWLERSGWAVALFLNRLYQPRLPRARLDELRRRVSHLYVIDRPLLLQRWAHSARFWVRHGLWRLGAMPFWRSLERVELEERFTPPSLLRELERRFAQLRPRAVIAEYAFMSGCFAATPGVLKIIDTHDVFSARAHLGDPLALTADDEAALLRRADLILAIQDEERRTLEQMVPERKVITVGVDVEPVAAAGADEVAGRVLYVGSDNELNARALADFVARAWPAVRARVPSARLRVVGRVAGRCPRGDGVDAVGFVDDLNAEYRRCQVAINPAPVGTGLKIKSAEALAWQKPLVTWPNGVAGLEQAVDPPYLAASDWDDFAAKLIAALTDGDLRAELSRRCADFTRRRFGGEDTYGELMRWMVSSQPRPNSRSGST